MVKKRLKKKGKDRFDRYDLLIILSTLFLLGVDIYLFTIETESQATLIRGTIESIRLTLSVVTGVLITSSIFFRKSIKRIISKAERM